MKYQKNSEIVDAYQLFVGNSIPDWVISECEKETIIINAKERLIYIDTKNGTHSAIPGDYVVKRQNGELVHYPKRQFEVNYTTLTDDRDKVINGLAAYAYHISVGNGWYDDQSFDVPVKLALIHSEVSEALEADRKNESEEKFTEELADVIIRTLDLAGALQLDIGKAVIEKMETNKKRGYKHGNRKY